MCDARRRSEAADGPDRTADPRGNLGAKSKADGRCVCGHEPHVAEYDRVPSEHLAVPRAPRAFQLLLDKRRNINVHLVDRSLFNRCRAGELRVDHLQHVSTRHPISLEARLLVGTPRAAAPIPSFVLRDDAVRPDRLDMDKLHPLNVPSQDIFDAHVPRYSEPSCRVIHGDQAAPLLHAQRRGGVDAQSL